MKKFIIVMSLVVILGGCTYNNYTAKQDEFEKYVKQDEIKQRKSEVKHGYKINILKTERDNIIKWCNKSSVCHFINKDGIDFLGLIVQNESHMATYRETLSKITYEFCTRSNLLQIPTIIIVGIIEERLAHNFDCSTVIWSEWYSTEKKTNGRY